MPTCYTYIYKHPIEGHSSQLFSGNHLALFVSTDNKWFYRQLIPWSIFGPQIQSISLIDLLNVGLCPIKTILCLNGKVIIAGKELQYSDVRSALTWTDTIFEPWCISMRLLCRIFRMCPDPYSIRIFSYRALDRS